MFVRFNLRCTIVHYLAGIWSRIKEKICEVYRCATIVAVRRQEHDMNMTYWTAGAHAAAFAALIRASHRRDVWLGGAAESDGSFLLTDEGHLLADRIFRAAFTSRS
jgi:prephenate dehydrogenase